MRARSIIILIGAPLVTNNVSDAMGDDLDDLLDEIEGEFREKSCKPTTSSYKGTGYVCSDVT